MVFTLPPLKGITLDSRQVQPGFLFVATQGGKLDGRQFIGDAITRGATLIAVPKGTPHDNHNVQWIDVENPRQFVAEAAAQFYNARPQHMVAVTGTNGKTSTVNFCRQLWAGLGIAGASLGTLGLLADGIADYNGMTTPDAVAIHQNLKLLADKHIEHLALEASSQGMDQERLYGLTFKAAGFTNLTQDHLDYHQTMEQYLDAKLRLMRELLAADGTAILNADDPYHEAFAAICRERGIRVWTYGANGKDLKIRNRQAVPEGQILDLTLFGQDVTIHLPLVGMFQAMNILCAVGMVCAERSIDIKKVIPLLENIEGIPGRLQKVAITPDGVGAYIDFAHTPDGLESVLTSLRPHTTGRLVCVFGCGGDRDRRKRPIMGEISARLADITIVTDDNPRSEDPVFVRSEILAGAPNATAIGGRQTAIRHAVALLQPGDVLVVAGKGHEQGQIFATHTDPFDDYTETQTALLNSLSPSA